MSDRIRVYKRDDSALGGDDLFTPRGYLRSRPWMVGPVPEDGRETCWPDWNDAMRWATDPEYRKARYSDDDAGW